MGAYLSVANKEKESSDAENGSFRYGVSAMQGWRTGMEDAHATVLDLDKDVSFFAIYDGHGGKEVAQYCSCHLHEELLRTQAYKDGDMAKALVAAYLRMDELMVKEEGRLELRALATATTRQASRGPAERGDQVEKAGKEATLQSNGSLEGPETSTVSLDGISQGEEADGEAVESPGKEGKGKHNGRRGQEDGQDREDGSGDCPESRKKAKRKDNGEDEGESVVAVAAEAEGLSLAEKPKKEEEEQRGKEEVIGDGEGDREVAEEKVEEREEEKLEVKEVEMEPLLDSEVNPVEEGMKENEEALKKLREEKGITDDEMKEEDDEEEDKDYVVGAEEEDDDYWTPDEEEMLEADEEEEAEEEDDDFWKPEEAPPEDEKNWYNGPTAGCTAVVAVVRGDDLVVANAGDSRCIMSRAGKAVELSTDHKPYLVEERERITLAGGFVSEDGRINGCLNLSRAIGDMEYKQNAELEPALQMVTAYPELQTLKLQLGDEFLVLACDGIWDVMSSQEVVDFVRQRLVPGKTVSSICEEMFEHCVAPNRHRGGAGMDNMSAVIVLLKKHISSKFYAESKPDGSDGSGG